MAGEDDGGVRAVRQEGGVRVSAGMTSRGATMPFSAMLGAKRRLYRLLSERASCDSRDNGGRQRGSTAAARGTRRKLRTHPTRLADHARRGGAPSDSQDDVEQRAPDEYRQEARELVSVHHVRVAREVDTRRVPIGLGPSGRTVWTYRR